MKKFLSLALALVMTLSLVTVAGAKEFTDDSKINYAEAVAVISAAGIIDGYTDGSFNPQGGLTRGAAAKIICNMILGPTTAAALAADAAPFADVPANHVFAGYIAYCAQQGIINGYADGLFRPAGALTGYQFMKMLLGALGYEGKYEGFTGANWSINVAKLALNLGLDDGNDDFVGTKALTREEACLYAFNTMKADMVEYDSNTSIAVGDVVISTSSKATPVYNKPSNDYLGRKTGDNADSVMQFIEKYFSDLWAENGKDIVDAYGRPALTWWNDDDEIGTYAEDPAETIVLDDSSVTVKKVLTGADYLNLKDTEVEEMLVKVNGVTDEEQDLMAGDAIEVFDTDDNDKYDLLVVIRYQVAKIDSVEDELSNNDVKKGASYAIDLKDLSDDFTTDVTATQYDDHDTKPVLKGFDAETYVKNAVLAVSYGEKVLASNVAETVEGQISAYKSGDKAAITIDGTKYPVAGAIQGTTNGMEFSYDDTEYTLYLDPNGYVIGLEGDTTVALEDVYLVTGLDTVDGKWGETTYVQAVALADGKIAEFVMGDAKDAGDDQTVAPKVDTLYSFTEDDGVYFAEKYDVDEDKVDVIGADAVKLTKDDTKYAGYYFTDDTLFIKVETDWKGDTSVKTVTGAISVDVNAEDVIVVFSKDGKAKDAEIVLIAAAEINSNLEASDIAYFSDNASATNADGYEAEAYFMDGTGAIETITYKKAAGKGIGGYFFKFSVDDDGIYSLTKQTTELTGKYKDETGFVTGATLTKVYKNALTVSDYEFTAEDVTLADEVVIIDERDAEQRDADLYKSEITSASRLQAAINKTNAVVTGTVFFDDEEVIFIAVTEVTDAE